MSARSRAGSLSSDEGGCLYELPFFAFVRGLRPPLTFLFARFIFRALNMPGISWSDKGNVGRDRQYLVRERVGKQDMVGKTADHNTISMDPMRVTSDIWSTPSQPMQSQAERIFSPVTGFNHQNNRFQPASHVVSYQIAPPAQHFPMNHPTDSMRFHAL